LAIFTSVPRSLADEFGSSCVHYEVESVPISRRALLCRIVIM
jgi:hypothetical protein